MREGGGERKRERERERAARKRQSLILLASSLTVTIIRSLHVPNQQKSKKGRGRKDMHRCIDFLAKNKVKK